MAASAFERAITRRNPAKKRVSSSATKKRLAELYFEHTGYVSDKWEHYLNIYDVLINSKLTPATPLRLLEIGVQNGGSLQIWSKYLPPGSTIVGIDIDPECANLSTPHNVRIELGDATDPSAMQGILGDARFDIIIDDGSHRSDDITATFLTCFDRLDWGGTYIIEDLHCSYFASYRGGFRKAGAALEWFKAFADCVNSDHFEGDAAAKLTPFECQQLHRWGEQVAYITFLDSVIIVQKHAAKKMAPYRRIMAGRDLPVANFAGVIHNFSRLADLILTPAATNEFSRNLLEALAAAKQEVGEIRGELAHATAAAALERLSATRNAEQLAGRLSEAERVQSEQRERATDELRAERHRREIAETERTWLRDEIRSERRRREELEIEGFRLQGELEAILRSTFWRITGPARNFANIISPRLRRHSRGIVKLAYWVLTPHRTPERIAFLRRPQEICNSNPKGVHCDDIQSTTDTHENHTSRKKDDPYHSWVREHDTLSDLDRRQIRAHIESLPDHPLISVVMPAYESDEVWFREAISSVTSQLYPYWELCVADDASPSPRVASVLAELAATDSRIKWVRREKNGHIAEATNSALGLATGRYVALMDHDDLLAEHALYEIAVEINAHPDADLIFSDEDHLDGAGQRTNPYFKPEWNLDLLLGHNMVSHLGVYRRSLVERIGGMRAGFEGSQDWDLALRVVAATTPSRIRHIPAVLYHWRDCGFSKVHLDRCAEAGRAAIRDHLRGLDMSGCAEVLPHPAVPGCARVRWPLPDPLPRVSVIVPTRDRPDLLARSAAGVLHRTDYLDLELIVVDNDSLEHETAVLLRGLERDERVRILHFSGPFNYSAINNYAVGHSTGDVVLLLNNDVEIIHADWLQEMVSHVVRPRVGAVGAKLLYADNTVQHAGVALGLGSFEGGPGVAGHFELFKQRSDFGYFGHNVLTRELSACTGACLALRRDVYTELGGLDELHLPVAFNDVDMCIRLRRRGYKIIWTPFAELYHLESASRGPDTAPEAAERFRREADYMRARWGQWLDSDPFLSPNFSRATGDFSLASPPLREKPWRKSPSTPQEEASAA